MPHADQLILAGRDAEPDPATELFLRDHLRECAPCRELQRKVERADRLLAARDDVAQVPARRDMRIAARSGRAVIASLVVVVLVVGVVAGTAIKAFRGGDGASQVAAPGGPSAPSLPKDWQLVTVHDLLIPLPPGWEKTIDAPANTDRPDPSDPWILYFGEPSADPATARRLAIWIWPSPSLEQLVRDRYIQGNLSLMSEGTVASWRPTREVLGVASWSDARGSGQYRARNLFVQVDPERVVLVTTFGPHVPSTTTEPSREMRAIQDLVIGHVVALRDVDRIYTAIQLMDPLPMLVPRDVSAGSARDGSTETTYGVKDRTDSVVRVFAYPDPGARRRSFADPTLLPSGVSAGASSTPRAIGNLVVWVSSPDANVRYTVLTALDRVLDRGVPALRTLIPIVVQGCPRTTDRDASGVITTSGQLGIVGDTSMSASAINDSFLLVKRGAVLGDRVSLEFVQIPPGTAPAQSVSYGVPATLRRTAWGEVAFPLGVKPIGFANSCWRLFVDGSDSGIVLFIGP